MGGLIVTCARHFEPDACDEIEKTLEQMGDKSAIAHTTSMSGIITVDTELDPQKIVENMRDLIDDEPWLVRYVMRVIPILQWIESNKDEIVSKVLQMSEKLLPNKLSYRITIEKRNSILSSRDLISAIAEKIPNKVSLENSEAIVLIQILGTRTGISVMRAPAILSVSRQKRLELD
ncbi:MAG: RNA methyltransferase [Cenarchaeum symbiont of Oopsacas minuta]|nr:RNA methyltransferase [Cenarchaeum symbiont of Oopsacas minuta]